MYAIKIFLPIGRLSFRFKNELAKTRAVIGIRALIITTALVSNQGDSGQRYLKL